jgi:hypothetical protein
MYNLENLGKTTKSTILHNKGKAVSIALILLLAFSSAISMAHASVTVASGTASGNNPGGAASQPGVVTQFDNGIEILAPTADQIATYITAKSLPTAQANPIFTEAPDPVGVGQAVAFIVGIVQGPPTGGSEFGGTSLSSTTNPLTGSSTNLPTVGGWGGYTVTITDPNGTATTFGPYVSNVSGLFNLYVTCTEPGAYKATFTFPGELAVNCTGNWSAARDGYYKGFVTSLNFTVQQNAVIGYTPPSAPSRSTYWTQPVPENNRPWYTVDGPWMFPNYNATSKFNPYTYAPATAHVLWDDRMYNAVVQGGNVGGDYGSLPFNNLVGWPTALNSYFGILNQGVIVFGGYIYYNSGGNGQGPQQFNCMSIQTGKLIWSQPGIINYGQLMNWRDATYKYVFPYLWYIAGTTWQMYDANSGQWLWNITGATAGTVWVTPPNDTVIGMTGGSAGGGDLQVLAAGQNSTNTGTWICLWSMEMAEEAFTGNTIEWKLTDYSTSGTNIVGSLVPWKGGILYNVTIPYAGYSIAYLGGYKGGEMALLKHALVKTTTDENFPTLGVDLNTGKVIWTGAITLPLQSEAGFGNYGGPGYDGVFTFWLTDYGQIMGFSDDNGSQLWATNITMNGYGNVQTYAIAQGYGCLYYGSYDGYMHCVSVTNGTQMWASHSAVCGFDFPSPYYPFANDPVNTGGNGHVILADYKVYDVTGKDHESEPLAAGHEMYCWDAITGQQLFNITGQYLLCAIADGIMVGYDNFDGNVYAFGMGQSATTLSAPLTSTAVSSPLVIQGTVTDQSPDATLHGTPAISDTWMSAWMGYELMDQPYPAQATGVPVQITAIDPNHNFVSIANVTSDISGNFYYTWTPPSVAGTYLLTATFPGSQSYYGSCAETSTVIVSAPANTPAPTATPTSVADMYFVPAIAGLFVLIIVVAIVLALLMLRKHP